MKRILFAFTVAALSLAFLGSCKREDAGASGAKVKIAFVTNVTADFWTYAEAGVRAAEKEFGDIEVVFKNGDGTTGKQKQIIDDLIVSGVKAIAISPTNPKDQKDMINEWADQIPVICHDSDAPQSKRLFYLGTDNVAAGKVCGNLLKEALPDGGKTMVFVGLRDQQNAIERFQGVKEAVKGTAIEILDLRTDNVQMDKARRNAEDTLINVPEIKGMVGLWAYNPPLIRDAVEEAGKLDQVSIVGFDEDPRTLQAIDKGHIYGTVAQNPYEFG